MLVASPIAGIYADRHGSRALAAIGMLVSAAGLAAMTTLQVHSAYWQSALWLAMVGVGSGMFNSPNTAAMMGVVPAKRRGIAAGARTLLQNTGAVLSIAFVLAIVTSSIPESHAVRGLLGPRQGPLPGEARPLHRQHARRALGARSRLAAGAFVCLLRPAHDATRGAVSRAALAERPRGRVSARRPSETLRPPPVSLRIGDVARLVGTTPRTIRYYEEIGLLPDAARAAVGAAPHVHRRGGRATARGHAPERAARRVAGGAGDAAGRRGGTRGGARAAAARATSTPLAGESCCDEALGHIDRQLELVRRRAAELAKLEHELRETRKRVKRKLRELQQEPTPSHVGATAEEQVLTPAASG